jgi:hypothetical protein
MRKKISEYFRSGWHAAHNLHTAHWLIGALIAIFPASATTVLINFAGEHSAFLLSVIFLMCFGLISLLLLALSGHPIVPTTTQITASERVETETAPDTPVSPLGSRPTLSSRALIILTMLIMIVGAIYISIEIPRKIETPIRIGTPTIVALTTPGARSDPPPLGIQAAFQIIDTIASASVGPLVAPGRFGPVPIWTIVITAPAGENADIMNIVSQLVARSLRDHMVMRTEPDINDRDAPKLHSEDSGHIVIHGTNSLAERLIQAFGRCFHLEKTTKIPEGFDAYYKLTEINAFVWIEIGKGALWREPRTCQE